MQGCFLKGSTCLCLHICVRYVLNFKLSGTLYFKLGKVAFLVTLHQTDHMLYNVWHISHKLGKKECWTFSFWQTIIISWHHCGETKADFIETRLIIRFNVCILIFSKPGNCVNICLTKGDKGIMQNMQCTLSSS